MVDASAVQSGVALGLLFTVILLVRTYRLVTGARLSVARLAVFTAFYLVLFALLVGEAYSLVPVYFLGIDALIVVATTVLALPYVRRAVTVTQRPDGQWYYRMGPIIPVVYLVLFLVRMGIDVAVLNESVAGPPVSTSLSVSGQIALLVVDALFAFSTGLLTARSIGVYQEYRSAAPHAPGSPVEGSA